MIRLQNYHKISDTTNKLGVFIHIMTDIFCLLKSKASRLIRNFNKMEKSSIYIGEIIRDVMSERQITKAELARRLNVRPQSVDYMLTRKSIDTDTLYNVSCALNYDFAQLYSIYPKQTNYDSPTKEKIRTAKVMVELELEPEDLLKLNIKKRIDELLK